ncbi:class I SAM-dependent methyltransferase [Actinophytocola oryzae]|uniref:Methyltransferase family protein n=1 Tax=Actinophytocola oryzae TaxID=502181 RepID=A0A4R7W2R9_9PSEU|nr:class I SAM-dependent methyltransferase [Actinophytocola oryzae]TDV56435.1 methyltransferase family protein [Actinophytocola oryzae]
MNVNTPAVRAWNGFAQKAEPRRSVNAAGAITWLNWTQYPDHGPDETVLGPVEGKRVVELGSGAGANLAHLATLGARCVGVDLAPVRTVNATAAWGHLPNLEFVTVDAVDHLAANPGRYDIAYSIFGAVWFTEPEVLLPLVRQALTPGGILAFSQLPADDTPPPPHQQITRQHLPVSRWRAVLTAAGFGRIDCELIPPPAENETGTVLIRAVAV